MNKGTVQWFCPEQGFGVIANDEGKGRIFVHYSSIKNVDGMESLVAGQKVVYDVKRDNRNYSKKLAVNVSVA